MKRPRRNPGAPVSAASEGGRAWISLLRLRALLWVVGIATATTAAIVLTSVSWVPLLGVAMAAVAMSLNSVGAKLSKPTCMTCGEDLSGRPVAEQGVPCPKCGGLNLPRAMASGVPAAAEPGPDAESAADAVAEEARPAGEVRNRVG
jgi:predicted RNA-binding Zn-ribbon protein involved in translation (DUF1610 family)